MAYQRIDQTPLLPAALRNRLGRWLLRATGSSVLFACAACSLALMTWSAADPSLSHVTNGAIRNVLGSVGAILADLLMQLLGLAGVLIVLPPLLWALPLSSGRPLRGWRSKFALAPVAVVAMAGALSALPTSITWTLHHGNGGMIGDLAFTGLAAALAVIKADKAGLAASLLLLAGGVLALLGSLGLSQHEWRQILSYPGSTRLERLTGTWRTLGHWLPTLPVPPLPHRFVGMRQEPPMYRNEARNAYRSQSVRAVPAVARPAEPALSQIAARAVEPLEEPVDQSSRAIAERFAPAGKQPAAPSLGERLPLLAPAPLARVLSTEVALSRPGPASYRRPPLAILKRQPAPKASDQLTQSALLGHARLLSDVLADFGIKGEIKGAHPGPVVTLFEFEPARGTKSARVIALAEDIARSMSAVSVRVAVVPGRNVIGIELPNLRREKVYLRELIETEAFRASTASLPLVLGKSISGAPVFADLARMPHLLVAGTTGAGKSVGVNAMILSLLYRLSPEECRFLMIDPKMLELSVYNGVPHLLCPVVTDPHKAVTALNWAVREMEERYERMSRLGVRHIDAFNARVRHGQRRDGAEADFSPLPFIVVVVDEFADLMLVAGKEIEAAVQRLAQMARAAGIHLIMATQRPSVDVITGTIKANFPTRISFKVASKFDSRTILNDQGAEQLLGQGDMLFSGGSDRLMRVHGPFVSDEEVEGMAAYLREQGTPCYIPGITDLPEEEAETLVGAQQTEALYDRAVGIVVRDGKPSISYLQRRLCIGYNRAAGLIERMEREGVIGPAADGGRRQILLGLQAPGRPAR
jgi:DNA segregation ATPase FtsK/SpoIIIE, S-DNA-T family